MKGVGDKEDDWAAVLRAALGLPASAEEPGKAAARTRARVPSCLSIAPNCCNVVAGMQRTQVW